MSMEHPSTWNDIVHAIDQVMKSAPPPASSNAVLLTKIYDRLKAGGYLTAAATQAVVEDAARDALATTEAFVAAGGSQGATPPFNVYRALSDRKLVQAP